MALEIRPIVKEELEAFNRNVRIAFASPDEFKIDIPVEWTLCAFDDGKLATSYMAWPLTMYFDTVTFPVAGVSMVGTLPVYRRSGYLRKLTGMHFSQLYEQGERSIAALYASMAAIYLRYGYGIVCTKHSYTFEPRHLRFADTWQTTGQFREAGDDETGLILDLYHRFAAPRTGYLRRSEKFEVAPGAPLTILALPPSQSPPLKVIYREDGEPQGYAIYSIERGASPEAGQRLMLRDLAWLTPHAYRALWEHFAAMDLVQDIVWGTVPPDDPLPHLLLEPRKLSVVANDGMLARIVDVKRALTLRPYAGTASLTFAVVDDFCPWNSGTWKLETSPGGADCSRTDGEPQLTVPASTLAMLFFGQLGATQAARMGRLDVNDAGALGTWDTVMRTAYRPFCADIF